MDLIVDLQGYFTAAGEHGSSFTPASGRLYDSRTTPTGWFSAGETRSIPLDGLAGVPDVTFGVTAAVLTLTSLGTTSGTGRAIVWADGTSQPNTTAISSGERVTRSNTITVPIGANGAINLQNIGNETHYVLDLQGWYVDPEAAPAQETLTVEQIEQLSDQEIQDMLEASALKVENAQAAYAATATPEEYTAGTAAYEEVAGELDRIIEAGGVSGLRAAVDAGEVVIDSPDIHSTDARCLTVHKWQLHTIGWILFAYGTFVTIAGLFASGTVIGLPLGAVAGAAGITLAATATHFIWRVDQLRWKSKRVCF